MICPEGRGQFSRQKKSRQEITIWKFPQAKIALRRATEILIGLAERLLVMQPQICAALGQLAVPLEVTHIGEKKCPESQIHTTIP